MNELGPRVQALIDGLARKHSARPRQDRATIEHALRAYLKRFAPWPRRIVWVDDAPTAFQYIGRASNADDWRVAAIIWTELIAFLVRNVVLVPAVWGLAAFMAVEPLALLFSWLAGDRTGAVLSKRFGPPSMMTATAAALILGSTYALIVWLLVRRARRRSAGIRRIREQLRNLRRYWDVATVAVAGEMSEVFIVDYWRHIRKNIPFAAHNEADREV